MKLRQIIENEYADLKDDDEFGGFKFINIAGYDVQWHVEERYLQIQGRTIYGVAWEVIKAIGEALGVQVRTTRRSLLNDCHRRVEATRADLQDILSRNPPLDERTIQHYRDAYKERLSELKDVENMNWKGEERLQLAYTSKVNQVLLTMMVGTFEDGR